MTKKKTSKKTAKKTSVGKTNIAKEVDGIKKIHNYRTVLSTKRSELAAHRKHLTLAQKDFFADPSTETGKIYRVAVSEVIKAAIRKQSTQKVFDELMEKYG